MAGEVVLSKLAVVIAAQTAEFNKALARTEGNFKSFTNNISSAGKLLAGAFGTVAVFQGLKAGIGIVADFEKTMSEAKAITGATGAEFKKLQSDALRLGASTKFTATQVGQLQIAYGRLGFSTKEILDATEATLNLAAATGEDLAKSADVAGSTVRGFGLNANETGRVVDVMASSFNKTALGLENFTESMKYVAPIANAANVTVEETTALLGVLADSGIRGSQAGTSLRKIFGDLTKDGRPLQERLAELSKKGITLADSYDEVGRTAQTALLVLSKNTDKTNELTQAFQNASGEAEQMARVMADNLSGDVTKLTSAFEGLILAISDGKFFRSATQELTRFINSLQGKQDISLVLQDLAESIGEISDAANNVSETKISVFVKELEKLRRESGRPIDARIASELSEKYQLTNEQANRLYSTILKINDSLSFQETVIKQFNEFATRNGYTDLNKAAEDYKQRLYELILAEQIRQDGFKESNINGAFDNTIKDIDTTIAGYRRTIDVLNEYKSTLKETKDIPIVPEETPGLIQAIEERISELGKSIKKALSVEEIRKFQKETKGLQQQLKFLLGEKQRDVKLKLSFNLSSIASEFKKAKDALKREFDEMAIFLSKFNSVSELPDKAEAPQWLKNYVASIRKGKEEIQKEIIDIGPLVANAITGLSDALGTAFATGNFKDFGRGLLDAMANFAQQLGGLLIASGVAEMALASGTPPAMIAAGAALVAIGAAVKATLSQKKSIASKGSYQAASQGSNNLGSINTTGNEIKLSGEFRIQGNDLVYIFNRQTQLNSRTR